MREKWWRLHTERGVTLVEVLVAIALLGLLVLGLPFLTDTARNSLRAEYEMTALQLARADLERLQQNPATAEPAVGVTLAAPFEDYRLTRQISVAAPALKRVTVTVERVGGDVRVELETLLAER